MTPSPLRPLILLALSLSLILAGCASPANDPEPGAAATPTGATPAPSSPTPTAGPPVGSPPPLPTAPVATRLGPAPIDLRSAGDFVLLAKSGVSTTGTTSIVGDVGVSPIDSTGITGFDLVMDASNEFSTSSLVTGKLYAADYAAPTPTRMTTAIGDMETAYVDAAGRTDPTATELGAGSIGGMTIAPGLYKWGTGVSIAADLTLAGGPDDVWIFQVAQTLDVASGVKVTLSGGAQASNVYWQVADQVTLGTTSAFKGNILGYSGIVLNTGATLDGRALSQTAVSTDANAITKA